MSTVIVWKRHGKWFVLHQNNYYTIPLHQIHSKIWSNVNNTPNTTRIISPNTINKYNLPPEQ